MAAAARKARAEHNSTSISEEEGGLKILLLGAKKNASREKKLLVSLRAAAGRGETSEDRVNPRMKLYIGITHPFLPSFSQEEEEESGRQMRKFHTLLSLSAIPGN